MGLVGGIHLILPKNTLYRVFFHFFAIKITLVDQFILVKPKPRLVFESVQDNRFSIFEKGGEDDVNSGISQPIILRAS